MVERPFLLAIGLGPASALSPATHPASAAAGVSPPEAIEPGGAPGDPSRDVFRALRSDGNLFDPPRADGLPGGP